MISFATEFFFLSFFSLLVGFFLLSCFNNLCSFWTVRLHTFPVNLMAYIPPHMRRSKDVRRASPIPETLQPQFQRKINLRASTSHKNKRGQIVYADHAIYKWVVVGLDDDGQFPTYIHLEPISLEYADRKSEEKPLVLVNSILTEGWCSILFC